MTHINSLIINKDKLNEIIINIRVQKTIITMTIINFVQKIKKYMKINLPLSKDAPIRKVT